MVHSLEPPCPLIAHAGQLGSTCHACIMMRTKAIFFRLGTTKTPSLFAAPHGMGHAKLGAGVPTSHPQHPQGLGLATANLLQFFWQKNGNLAMAKNGKLIACVTFCGPLASCGSHPNGPKCANGHKGDQGFTRLHTLQPSWPFPNFQLYFQTWKVPHTH